LTAPTIAVEVKVDRAAAAMIAVVKKPDTINIQQELIQEQKAKMPTISSTTARKLVVI
jgi:hypothetical protein